MSEQEVHELGPIDGLTSDEVLLVQMAMDRALYETRWETWMDFQEHVRGAYDRFLEKLPLEIDDWNLDMSRKVMAFVTRHLVEMLVAKVDKDYPRQLNK